MFYRSLALTSLVVVTLLQTGCCSSPCGKGMGCGRTYWGAYYDNPPTCEPCDKCGNWTGGNKNCKQTCNKGCDDNFCDFQWNRGQKVSFLGGLFNCDMFNGGCGKESCSTPACGEPACGEPSCAEPGCGVESAPATTHFSETPASQVSYSPSTWGSVGSGRPCNCGKH